MKHPGVGGGGEEQLEDVSSSEVLDDGSSDDEEEGRETVGVASTWTSTLQRDLRGETLIGASCKGCSISAYSLDSSKLTAPFASWA